MSKRAEELSVAYTDARLELLRPDIAADNYTRDRKMSLDVFDGNEVESAYEAGYEQAEKDTIARAVKWLTIYQGKDLDYLTGESIELFKEAMKKED